MAQAHTQPPGSRHSITGRTVRFWLKTSLTAILPSILYKPPVTMSSGEAAAVQQAARESGPAASASEGLPLASQPGVEAAVAPSVEIGPAPAAHELGPVATVLGSGTFGSAAAAHRTAPMEVEPPGRVETRMPTPPPTPLTPLTAEMQEVIQLWTDAQVPDPMMRYLGLTCGLDSVSTFLDYVARKDSDAEWRDIVQDAFPVTPEFTAEQRRLYVAKVRGAYRVALEMEGQQAANKTARAKDAAETDLEKAMSAEDVAKLKKAWDNLHTWSPTLYMKPHPPLRNRVWREFRGWTMTLHHVEKAVTIQDTKQPQETERTPIGGEGSGLYHESAKPAKRVIRTTLEYVAALRLLTGTYAFCGAHAVPSKVSPGHMTLMMTWEAALGYADTVTEKVIKVNLPEHAKLQWLRARDEQTRADMAQMVCEEWPAHEALDKAMEKQAHYWRMLDNLVAAPPPPELRADDARPQKRRYEEAPWSGHKGGTARAGAVAGKGKITIATSRPTRPSSSSVSTATV